MKAAVYFGPQDIRCTSVPDSVLREDHGVLVRVLASSICGSDLHLYRGALDPIMEKGKSQTGHELIGEVLEVGKQVARFRKGDRISMGYSASCGDCPMCRLGQTAHCETTHKAVYGFGIPFGNLNGTHAETMVLPHADGHALKLPAGLSERAAVTLSCNLPSALIGNRLADIQLGETVALIGCGPTGLMALEMAMHRGPGRLVAIDTLPGRLAIAARKGASPINSQEPGWREIALQETGGRGFDKVIEVVGLPETLQMALDLVRPGGTVAALGVFCDNTFNLNLADVFLRDITLHMNGFCNVQPAMADALQLIERGVINPDDYFSHTFPLSEIDQAFATFFNKTDGAMKVLIKP